MIPIVKASTGLMVWRSVESDEEFITRELKKLQESNPYIAEYILRMAMSLEDPGPLVHTAVLVYKLLEKQAELDNKSKENQ